MSVNFIYMTAGNKAEAQNIGKELVTSRLAACVNKDTHTPYPICGKLVGNRSEPSKKV